MSRLALLFVLVPLVELLLLVRLGGWIGFLPTALLVVATGILGAFLIRREGLRTLLAVQLDLARGKLPTQVLLDGILVLVAGALLLTPGVLTDLAGLLLLLPPSRAVMRRWAEAKLAAAAARGTVRFATGGFSWTRAGSAAPHAGSADRDGSPLSDAGSRVGLEGSGDLGSEEAATRRPRPGEIIQE
jgi:UPF0716 protein FxsA